MVTAHAPDAQLRRGQTVTSNLQKASGGVCIYPLFTCQGSRRRPPTPIRLVLKAEPTAGPGFEPGAPGLQPSALPAKRTSVLSAQMLRRCLNRRGRARTGAYLFVRQALYQLSYAASLAHRSRERHAAASPARNGAPLSGCQWRRRDSNPRSPGHEPGEDSAPLHRIKLQSRWLGSNQQPHPYEGHALPLSYTVHFSLLYKCFQYSRVCRYNSYADQAQV